MNQFTVKRMTSARIPTEAGEYHLALYHSQQDKKEHLALIMGQVSGQQDVLVRVHSECFTGDVLGSLRCDCGQQLDQAIDAVAQEGMGVVIYLRQEGRGIGLLDKLRAYNLQDAGYDTVEANLMLGHQADARDYTLAGSILQELGVASIRLMTNNPAKIESLEAQGITITARVPLPPKINRENAGYLTTKAKRMRHLLNLQGATADEEVEPLKADARQRPYVTLTYAQSVDGSITVGRGQPILISGPQSLTLTHHLRQRHDAILVGIGTVLADDPRLTVRRVSGQDPQPIVLDSRLRFPADAKMLANGRPPWIATTHQARQERIQELEEKGARVLRLPANENGRVHLPSLLQKLAGLGIGSMMVEGGADVITSFLAAQLVDRVVLTVAPILVGGLNAIGGLAEQVNGHGLPLLRNPSYQWLGDDVVLTSEVVWEAANDEPD